MSLSPTGFDILQYNMPNWSAILNSNWELLNTNMTKFNILWDSSGVNGKSIKWDSTQSKWVSVYNIDIKNNLGAIIPPVATDDSSLFYSIGSRWIDTVAKKLYVCVDNTVGGAIWEIGSFSIPLTKAQGGTGNLVGNSTVAVVTNEAIPAFAVTTVTGYIADSTNMAHRGKVIGMTLSAIASGIQGEVITNGEVVNVGWSWASGDILFLNGTSLSTIAPNVGFSQQIGKAVNATTIAIDIKDSIAL